LCDRYQIDNSARTLHGALLDAQLLAEVYLAMTRGQESLMIEEETLQITLAPANALERVTSGVVLPASAEEVRAHDQHLSDIKWETGRECVWQQIHEHKGTVVAAV
jgi:DNA polymerase-3 subunit epsilon